MDAPSQTSRARNGVASDGPNELEIRYRAGPEQPCREGSASDGLDLALARIDPVRTSILTAAVEGSNWAQVNAAALTGAIETWPNLERVHARWHIPGQSGGIQEIAGLHQACQRRNLAFTVDIVLDAGADPYAALSDAPSSLTPALRVCRELRSHGVAARWLIPAIPPLIYRLEALFSLARAEEIEAILIPWDLAGLGPGAEQQPLSPDDRLFAKDFIAYRILEEEKDRLTPGRCRHYRALIECLDGESIAHNAGTLAVLEPSRSGQSGWTASLEQTDLDRRALALHVDRRRRVAEAAMTVLIDKAIEAAEVLLDGCRAHLMCSLAGIAGLLNRRKPMAPGRPLPRVMLIGAYGGEHIGDAAILGGVLLRLHARHGTTRAVLMTQRPDHTRHLVPMLDAPVQVEVDTYEMSRIRQRIKQVDAVVFAGGPLTDLPKQLVRHLYAVSLGRLGGKPFIAEGIGPGPFPRWPSEVTARRLVKMADRVSIRTRDDAERRVIRGLNVDIGRDPAFDYLAGRQAELTRLPDLDRVWIERLSRDTEGRLLVGINLRPIGHHYTFGIAAGERESYTRLVEDRFEQQFAEGLRAFEKTSKTKPCFVFFPMNAIQFGKSDLRSAFRIKSRLGADTDFRVWEGDASLDGVVDLLRRLDIAITMRFHATIFALSQGCGVIGIDYRVGKRDKVAAVLSDAGQIEHCTRIDQLTSDWLAGQLTQLSASAPKRPGPA